MFVILSCNKEDIWGGYFINWGHFNNHVKQIKLANTISYPKAFKVFFTVPSKICPGSIKLEQGCSSCILSVGMKYVIWCYFYQFFMPHYLCKYFFGSVFQVLDLPYIVYFILVSKDLIICLQAINQILWSILDNISFLTSVF